MTDQSQLGSTGVLAKARAASLLTPEEQLSGDMLMLTTGFMMCAAALWLAIYWSMGHLYSTTIPLIFMGLSGGDFVFTMYCRELATPIPSSRRR